VQLERVELFAVEEIPVLAPRPRAVRATGRRLVLELLEARAVPATLTVNTTVDEDNVNETLSLREAIRVVNGAIPLSSLSPAELGRVDQTTPLGASDTIRFNFTTATGFSIPVTAALPALSKPVIIDGANETTRVWSRWCA